MLEELSKEMCAGFIKDYDPEYISVDNVDDNGRTVADCGISKRQIVEPFAPIPSRAYTNATIWDVIKELSDYGPNTRIYKSVGDNSNERIYTLTIPKTKIKSK